MAVLVVGSWRSECFNCRGSNVDPDSKAYTSNLTGSGPVCNEEFTSVVSSYSGQEEIVRDA